jgi:uncharacterized membrane protein YdjX (TVP38/TMEM64 family)
LEALATLISNLKEIINAETINYWINQYASFGPLPGMVLAMLESVFPPIPLFAVVAGNAAAFGLWWGSLFSWIGTTLGSILVFSIFRSFSKRKLKAYLTRHPKAKRFFLWIERKGFTPIFMLYCFPFTPSSLVNITTGLSSVPFYIFFIAVALGKFVMVFIMSFIGYDLVGLFTKPWRLILVAVVILVMWFGGKWVEKRYLYSHHEPDVQ